MFGVSIADQVLERFQTFVRESSEQLQGCDRHRGYRIPRARPRRLFERHGPPYKNRVPCAIAVFSSAQAPSPKRKDCFDITQDAGFVVVPRQSRRMTEQFRWPRQRGQWTAEI